MLEILARHAALFRLTGENVSLRSISTTDYISSALSLGNERCIRKLTGSESHLLTELLADYELTELAGSECRVSAASSTNMVVRGLTGLLLPNTSKFKKLGFKSQFVVVVGLGGEQQFCLGFNRSSMKVEEEGRLLPVTLNLRLQCKTGSGDTI